jgi:hypothetical protein
MANDVSDESRIDRTGRVWMCVHAWPVCQDWENSAVDQLINRLVAWIEKPRYKGQEATVWRARITAVEGQTATLELLSPCTGRAFAPISELFDSENGAPLSLVPLRTPEPCPTPEPGDARPRVRKPIPISMDLFDRLPGLTKPMPEPRFHVPTGPIASPSAPRRDRADSDIEAARAWLRTRAPAIEGQRGRPHTFSTVCVVMYGWELGEHDTLMLVSEWNTWCKPPWQPHELAATVQHAAKHGSKHKPGFMRRRRGQKPRKERGPRRNPFPPGMMIQFDQGDDGPGG